jgi:carboxyl-terminal processing protease
MSRFELRLRALACDATIAPRWAAWAVDRDGGHGGERVSAIWTATTGWHVNAPTQNDSGSLPLPSRYVRLLTVVALAAILVGGSYTAGYVSAARTYSAATVPPPMTTVTPATADRPDLKLFWEAWDLAQKEFYKPEALDSAEMTYGAIRGMLASLGDAHTSFASPEQSKVADEDMRGAFDGIGVSMEMRDNLVTVVSPLDGSPGGAAGIKAGDVVLKIDGKDATTLTLSEAVALIRGPRGSTVELTIHREGEPAPLVIKVTRAEIKVETVQTKTLDGNIGYVKITQFAEPTAQLLVDKLGGLMARKPKALILDLRNNPGGLLGASVDVASQFMADGVVLYQKSRGADTQVHTVKKGGLATDVPMIVLVNGGSASASEIVAGALQDNGRARLVGEPTYGKDTVQNVHHLSDNSTVRISISQWLTPKQQDIHEKGLQPDIKVPLTKEDFDAQRDPQLDRALQELRQPAPASQEMSLVNAG